MTLVGLDPDATALELLNRSNQKAPPVDLTSILQLWPGLHVTYDWLDKEGYLLDLGKQGGEIVVRADNLEPRRRYTIAHELGHWVLHKNGFPKADKRDAQVEKWCDVFGASLLMPASWVISDLRRSKLIGFAKNVSTAHKRYLVSPEAFRLRLSEIAPVSVFETTLSHKSLSIKRRYETKRLPRQLVHKTFAKASSDLMPNKEPRQMFVDNETSLVALSVPVKFADYWIVCVLPRTPVKQTEASH